MPQKNSYNAELSHIKARLEQQPNLQKWLNRKKILEEGAIEGVSKENQKILLEFLNDRELGLYVQKEAVKGARTPNRLLKLLTQLCTMCRLLDNTYLLEVTPKQINKLIDDLNKGIITKSDGQTYKSVREFIKDFKTFWHWYQEKNRREHKKLIEDITIDLYSPKTSISEFFYLNREEIDSLIRYPDKKLYSMIVLLAFDSGLRTYELKKIQVRDFKPHIKEKCLVLHLPDSKAKKGSHGRDINLVLSSEVLNKWLKNRDPNEFLLADGVVAFNRFLKRATKALFPEYIKKYGRTMHSGDLRHCSACYWVQRYPKERELMYRFGWRKSDKIEYYTSFLGIKDTMTSDQLLIEADKSKLQKELDETRDKLKGMEDKMKTIQENIARQVLAELQKNSGDIL